MGTVGSCGHSRKLSGGVAEVVTKSLPLVWEVPEQTPETTAMVERAYSALLRKGHHPEQARRACSRAQGQAQQYTRAIKDANVRRIAYHDNLEYLLRSAEHYVVRTREGYAQ